MASSNFELIPALTYCQNEGWTFTQHPELFAGIFAYQNQVFEAAYRYLIESTQKHNLIAMIYLKACLEKLGEPYARQYAEHQPLLFQRMNDYESVVNNEFEIGRSWLRVSNLYIAYQKQPNSESTKKSTNKKTAGSKKPKRLNKSTTTPLAHLVKRLCAYDMHVPKNFWAKYLLFKYDNTVVVNPSKLGINKCKYKNPFTDSIFSYNIVLDTIEGYKEFWASFGVVMPDLCSNQERQMINYFWLYHHVLLGDTKARIAMASLFAINEPRLSEISGVSFESLAPVVYEVDESLYSQAAALLPRLVVTIFSKEYNTKEHLLAEITNYINLLEKYYQTLSVEPVYKKTLAALLTHLHYNYYALTQNQSNWDAALKYLLEGQDSCIRDTVQAMFWILYETSEKSVHFEYCFNYLQKNKILSPIRIYDYIKHYEHILEILNQNIQPDFAMHQEFFSSLINALDTIKSESSKQYLLTFYLRYLAHPYLNYSVVIQDVTKEKAFFTEHISSLENNLQNQEHLRVKFYFVCIKMGIYVTTYVQHLRELARDKGNKEAAIYLAIIYENNYIENSGVSRAINMLVQYMDKYGQDQAILGQIAKYYIENPDLNCPKLTIAQLIEKIETLDEPLFPAVTYNLALLHAGLENYELALPTLLSRAEQNEMDALCVLTLIYGNPGSIQNIERAYHFAKRAYDMESMEAAYYCGILLQNKELSDKNPDLNWLDLLTQSAKTYGPAQYLLTILMKKSLVNDGPLSELNSSCKLYWGLASANGYEFELNALSQIEEYLISNQLTLNDAIFEAMDACDIDEAWRIARDAVLKVNNMHQAMRASGALIYDTQQNPMGSVISPAAVVPKKVRRFLSKTHPTPDDFKRALQSLENRGFITHDDSRAGSRVGVSGAFGRYCFHQGHVPGEQLGPRQRADCRDFLVQIMSN